MASLWTSRYPSEVGGTVVPNSSGINVLERKNVLELSEAPPTLAGLLAGAGYQTIAVVPNAWAIGLKLALGFGVQRYYQLDAEALTDLAIAEVDTHLDADRSSPFFLWIHYLDIHEPLDPPEPYRSRYPTADGAPHTHMHTGWDYRLPPDPSLPAVQAFRSHKIALL